MAAVHILLKESTAAERRVTNHLGLLCENIQQCGFTGTITSIENRNGRKLDVPQLLLRKDFVVIDAIIAGSFLSPDEIEFFSGGYQGQLVDVCTVHIVHSLQTSQLQGYTK